MYPSSVAVGSPRTAGDFAAIHGLYATHVFGTDAPRATVDEFTARIRKEQDSGTRTYFLVRDDDGVVGQFDFRSSTWMAGATEIALVSARRPTYRAGRLVCLLAFVEAFVHRRLDRLVWMTREDNIRALRAWPRLGAQRCGRWSGHVQWHVAREVALSTLAREEGLGPVAAGAAWS